MAPISDFPQEIFYSGCIFDQTGQLNPWIKDIKELFEIRPNLFWSKSTWQCLSHRFLVGIQPNKHDLKRMHRNIHYYKHKNFGRYHEYWQCPSLSMSETMMLRVKLTPTGYENLTERRGGMKTGRSYCPYWNHLAIICAFGHNSLRLANKQYSPHLKRNWADQKLLQNLREDR